MTWAFSKKLTFATISVLIVALMIFALLGVTYHARAVEQYEGEMILETSVVTTATESAPGVYESIAKDDTFTVTYKLVKNDGMVESAFTPAYDKDAFELTSFTVDASHWTLFNDYDGMTAAEYIADRNGKYAAGEIADFRLTFEINYADVRDPNGTLSDSFITIVYTARAALVAPANAGEYAFGFDTTTLGGFYTCAAKAGDKLLELKLKVGEEQGEPVTEALGAEDYVIRVWTQTAFEYKFRATLSSADLLAGASYALAWDAQADKFVIATTPDPVSGDPVPALTADGAEFELGDAIPTATNAKGFYVKKWWRVIPQQVGDPELTAVTTFDVSASVETTDGAYYLAEMAFGIGAGDVNGDGVISTLDLLTMKKYLVDASSHATRTASDAWDVAYIDDASEAVLYPSAWDVNGDGRSDTRDLVALREALATGYGYQVVTGGTADGTYCPGGQVAGANAVVYDGYVA